jgi:PAS domain S-box-containing protein
LVQAVTVEEADKTPATALLPLLDGEREMLAAIATGESLTKILNNLAHAVEAQSAGTSVRIRLVREGQLLTGASPSLPSSFSERLAELEQDTSASPCAVAMLHGEPVYVADIEALRGYDPFRELALQHGLRACWCAPIGSADGQCIGTFAIYHHEPRGSTLADEQALAFMARAAAVAIERHHAIEALRESEDHHRHAVELNPQVVWTSRPDGQLDHVAHRWMEWTGTTGLGSSWADATHPEDQERSFAVWGQAISSGEPYDIEHRIRLINGDHHWMHSRAYPRRNASGAIVKWYGTTEDIHERKRAEEELRQSRDRLAAESHALEVLNRTGAQVAAELDVGRLVQLVVDAGVELTGAAFGAFFYGADAEDGQRMMLYALSGAPREAFSNFGMPRATQIFAPTFEGKGILRVDDITADPRYGHNAPYSGMPEGHPPVRSYLAVPVASRDGSVIGGLFFGHPDAGMFGERSEHAMAGLAAQAAIGLDNARLFQDAQREVAERRRTEDALRELNTTLEERVATAVEERAQIEEALRQAQKMEAVGQLTGGIAHDFNNLLTGIMGSLELMQRKIQQGKISEIDRYIHVATTSADRAAALTHRLLAFSRRQPLDPRTVEPARLIGSMEDLLRRTMGEAIEIEIRTAPDAWPALCDPHQLESAILNLAINARDAMPDGGLLVIEIGNVDLNQATLAEQRDVAPGQYVCISVSDTGTGMTPDVISRAFEPFFTTKPLGQGTGLGLSMIYGFARQSLGGVRIESQPGQGSTIRIYLPRSRRADTPEGGEDAIQDDAPPAATGETVLVVEDEEAVRTLVVEVLRDLGYVPVEAVDGPSGLRILESDLAIDLMITDVGLPGLNGRQLADAAREHRPALKILFMTGYAESAAMAGGFLAPGMEMMTKPFAMEEITARVREMIERT